MQSLATLICRAGGSMEITKLAFFINAFLKTSSAISMATASPADEEPIFEAANCRLASATITFQFSAAAFFSKKSIKTVADFPAPNNKIVFILMPEN